ncbi:ash family protein [Pseudomonas lalucatii]|nr:ash family protein [Pseudomonas lalucatii]
MLGYRFSMVGRAGQASAWPVPLVPGCHPVRSTTNPRDNGW